MSRHPTLAAAAVLGLAVPGPASPAWAASDLSDRPFVVPQRDVDVIYAVPVPVQAGEGQVPSGAVTQRMRFSIDPLRQRVDPPGPGTYMITDYPAGRLIVVQPDRHLATSLPAPGGPIAPQGVRATGDYRRLGPQAIAGARCTDWATGDQSGNASIVCLTDDGVLLRAMQGGQVLLQAVQVAYGRQPADVFSVPAGYRLLQASQVAR